eukprot:9487495-Pyramimonas_sp.AAC.1
MFQTLGGISNLCSKPWVTSRTYVPNVGCHLDQIVEAPPSESVALAMGGGSEKDDEELVSVRCASGLHFARSLGPRLYV